MDPCRYFAWSTLRQKLDETPIGLLLASELSCFHLLISQAKCRHRSPRWKEELHFSLAPALDVERVAL